MKFAVDRIEGEYAILENIETGEKREELLNFFPYFFNPIIYIFHFSNKFITVTFKNNVHFIFKLRIWT